MSLRRAIIEADTSELNVAEFCRLHGVSTWFFWDLRRRHRAEGDVVLEPKSRAPHRPANRTPAAVEDAIVAKRKELDDAGWDCGAASIAFYLQGLAGLPSEATIWRILRARGMIVPQPSKAPKHAGRSFTAERANECWALDDWEHELADGTIVHILDIIDDHSRYAAACRALEQCSGAASIEVFLDAAGWLGLPERFWSDNAKAFTATLANAVGELGVIASHTRPYSPNSNGKAERFHQTAQKWLAKRPPAATIGELQDQLDLFRLAYNTERPHRSLARRFPAEVWTTAPKSGPRNQPLGQNTTVHHSTVHRGRCHAGRYQISLGSTYNGQHALTVITGTAAHVFINGHLARKLTLNADTTRQPLHNRRGRPSLTEREAPRHP